MSAAASAPWPAVVDGIVSPDGRVDLQILGGAFQHGEGLFETLPVIGGRPRFLAEHVRRIQDGAEALGLGPAPDLGIWREDLRSLVDANGGADLAARLFLFHDEGRVRRAVAAGPLPADAHAPAAIGLADPIYQGPRPLARHKTLNYLAARLAHRAGVARGLDEVLFTLADGTILEGTRSTVFLVRLGTLVTPPLSLPILPGVTRAVLLEEARGAGMPVREEGFRLEDLQSADEAFLTASLRGVRPVRSVAGRAPAHVNGPATRRLSALFRDRIARE